MKRIIIVLVMLALTSLVFADIAGSVDSETTYDADAETLKEVVDTSVTLGNLSIKNKFTFADLLYDAEAEEELVIDWAGEIAMAFTDAIKAGVKMSSKGADEVITLELNAGWTITDFLAIRAVYKSDNLNTPEGEDAEIGSFTFGAKLSF